MKQQGVKYAYNDKWHYFILFAETEIQGRPKCAGSAVFVNLSILIIFCTNTNSPAYYNINNGGQDILGSAGDQWQHSNRQSRTSRDLISEHQCFRLPDDWSQTRNTFCGTWYLSHCHTLLTTSCSVSKTATLPGRVYKRTHTHYAATHLCNRDDVITLCYVTLLNAMTSCAELLLPLTVTHSAVRLLTSFGKSQKLKCWHAYNILAVSKFASNTQKTR